MLSALLHLHSTPCRYDPTTEWHEMMRKHLSVETQLLVLVKRDQKVAILFPHFRLIRHRFQVFSLHQPAIFLAV